jgi:hypothetical protein
LVSISHWSPRFQPERRHRNKIAIPAKIKIKPRAIHRQEPLESRAVMLVDGSGVQVETGPGVSGTEVVAVMLASGETVESIGEKVEDGEGAAGREALGDGCVVDGKTAVSVSNGVALPASTGTVAAGDDEATIVGVPVGEGTSVPVGEATTVSEGIAVSEGTPGG